MTTRILVVCLGNICRSPMGQGVIEKRAAEAGLALEVDSAGLGAWHVGNPPNPRGLQVASARGYDNTGQRARQVRVSDFHDFDLILGMDADNIAGLERLRPEGADVEVRLFHPSGQDIPDPYYGGLPDYEHALDLIEAAVDDLVERLATNG
jgi:low molecular weight protein-tyrosine phosphatase